MLQCAAALAVLLAVAAPAAGFYLPGVAPSDFAKVRWVPAACLPPRCAPGNGCVTVFVFGGGSGQRGAAPGVGIRDPADQLECSSVVCSFHDRWSRSISFVPYFHRWAWDSHVNSQTSATVPFGLLA
jgi:hypothetical protein